MTAQYGEHCNNTIREGVAPKVDLIVSSEDCVKSDELKDSGKDNGQPAGALAWLNSPFSDPAILPPNERFLLVKAVQRQAREIVQNKKNTKRDTCRSKVAAKVGSQVQEAFAKGNQNVINTAVVSATPAILLTIWFQRAPPASATAAMAGVASALFQHRSPPVRHSSTHQTFSPSSQGNTTSSHGCCGSQKERG